MQSNNPDSNTPSSVGATSASTVDQQHSQHIYFAGAEGDDDQPLLQDSEQAEPLLAAAAPSSDSKQSITSGSAKIMKTQTGSGLRKRSKSSHQSLLNDGLFLGNGFVSKSTHQYLHAPDLGSPNTSRKNNLEVGEEEDDDDDDDKILEPSDFKGKFKMGTTALTCRSICVGSFVGAVLCFLTMYFFLHLSEASNGNYTASILSFIMMKFYTARVASFIGDKLEFGASENLMMQTIATGAGLQPYNTGLAGPLVNFLCKVVENYAEQGLTTNDNITDCYNPTIGQLFAWCYVISLYGVFLAIPLYRQFIVRDKLPFPDGQAIAKLLASLHSPNGDAEGLRQAMILWKVFAFSSIYMFLHWGWGLASNFPIFGVYASNSYFWYMDMDTAQIAYGILVPFIIVVWMMIGTIIGWGVIGPVVLANNGTSPDYTFASYDDITSDFVRNVGIFIILSDGFYELIKMFGVFSYDYYKRYQIRKELENRKKNDSLLGQDMTKDTEVEEDTMDVPTHIWATGAIANFILILAAVPFIFGQSNVYITVAQSTVAVILSPIVGTSIIYGAGLTNQLAGSAAGKFGIMIFQIWDGHNSSVLGPLALGAILTCVASMGGGLLTDFKSAYLLGISVRSMFYGQIIGALVGATFTVAAFELFTAGDIPNQQFPLWYSLGFRQLALVFSNGLPPATVPFIVAGILITVVSNIIRDTLVYGFGIKKAGSYAPIMIAIGLGFYLPPTYQLVMGFGGIWRLYWKWVDPDGFEQQYAAVAAGMITASGIVGLITSLIAFAPNTPWVLTVYNPNNGS